MAEKFDTSQVQEKNGTIFKNDKKESDKHPDYKGRVKLNGEMCDIALWLRTSKNDPNKKYFSVKISDPYKKQDVEQTQQTSEDTSDLPF